jgi:DNA-3-methyladenine glycosylase II
MKKPPYKRHLSRDPHLRELLKTEVVVPPRTRSLVLSLVWSILSQQLSIQVAKVLYERFLKLFGNRPPGPRRILAVPWTELRAIGVSSRKAEYIHNVARFILARRLTLAKLDRLGDDEIIELLTQVTGVGRWTVEMLLIFGLERPDVFAVDDLGVQKAMVRLFSLDQLPRKELRRRMLELSRRWSPYRSYVCLHMWKFSGFES